MTTTEATVNETAVKTVAAGSILHGQHIAIDGLEYSVEGTASAGNDKVLLELSNGPYLSTIIADVNKSFTLV